MTKQELLELAQEAVFNEHGDFQDGTKQVVEIVVETIAEALEIELENAA